MGPADANCLRVDSEGSEQGEAEDQVVKKLEQFNSVCDELYKEIVRCALWDLVSDPTRSMADVCLVESSGGKKSCST